MNTARVRAASRSRPRYFDLVPPEILRQVFETLAPHDVLVEDYQVRQDSLTSLCLTSKLCREIAQPLLFDVVHLCEDRPNRLEKLLAQSDHWSRTKRIIVTGSTRGEDVQRLSRLAVEATILANVTLAFSSAPEPFVGTSIKSLHLGMVWAPQGFAFCFPLLEQLSIGESRGLKHASTTINLPSLRHIAVASASDRFVHEHLLPTLAPQLVTLRSDGLGFLGQISYHSTELPFIMASYDGKDDGALIRHGSLVVALVVQDRRRDDLRLISEACRDKDVEVILEATSCSPLRDDLIRQDFVKKGEAWKKAHRSQ
ncbi:hypothetical protein JCM11491_001912 [Sporobolomyces phaffii]